MNANMGEFMEFLAKKKQQQQQQQQGSINFNNLTNSGSFNSCSSFNSGGPPSASNSEPLSSWKYNNDATPSTTSSMLSRSGGNGYGPSFGNSSFGGKKGVDGYGGKGSFKGEGKCGWGKPGPYSKEKDKSQVKDLNDGKIVDLTHLSTKAKQAEVKAPKVVDLCYLAETPAIPAGNLLGDTVTSATPGSSNNGSNTSPLASSDTTGTVKPTTTSTTAPNKTEIVDLTQSGKSLRQPRKVVDLTYLADTPAVPASNMVEKFQLHQTSIHNGGKGGAGINKGPMHKSSATEVINKVLNEKGKSTTCGKESSN